MRTAVAVATRASIEQRVVRAAEAALRDHGYVAPVDLLVGMGMPGVPRDQARRRVREDVEAVLDRWRKG